MTNAGVTATLDGEPLERTETYLGSIGWNASIGGEDARVRCAYATKGVKASVEMVFERAQCREEFPLALAAESTTDAPAGEYVFEPLSGPYTFEFRVRFDIDEFDSLPPAKQPWLARIEHPIFELAVGDVIEVTTVPGTERRDNSQGNHQIAGTVIGFVDNRGSAGAVESGLPAFMDLCELTLTDGDTTWLVEWQSGDGSADDDGALRVQNLDHRSTPHVEQIILHKRQLDGADTDVSGFPVFGPEAGTNANNVEGKDVPADPLAVAVEAERAWLDADLDILRGSLDTDSPDGSRIDSPGTKRAGEVRVRYDAKYGNGEKAVTGVLRDAKRQEHRPKLDAAEWPQYHVRFETDEGTYWFEIDAHRDGERVASPIVHKVSYKRADRGLGHIRHAEIEAATDS